MAGSEGTSWPSGIAAITLFVEDLPAAKRFYQDVFGLAVRFEDRRLGRVRLREHDGEPAEDHGRRGSSSSPPPWHPERPDPAFSSPSRWMTWMRCARSWQARRGAVERSDGSAVGRADRQFRRSRRPHLGDRGAGSAMSFDVAGRGVRPLHGQVLAAAFAATGGPRRGEPRPTGRSMSAAVPGHSPPSWSPVWGPAAVAAVDPSEPFVAAARARNPGVEVAAGVRRATAVPGPVVRRGPRAARRPFHVGSGRRIGRDGAGDPARWCRRRVRLGSRRWPGPAQPLLARGAPCAIPRSRMNWSWRASARATWRSCSTPRGCTRSRRQSFRSASSTRASTTWWEPFTRGVGPAGSYTASLMRNDRPSCARRAEPCSRLRRSCSRLWPGQLAASHRLAASRGCCRT